MLKGRWKGTEVAVKRLNYGPDEDLDDVVRKLQAEASVFSQLKHRNIVQFIGACSVDPNFCIVLEFVEKGPLNRHLRKTLPPRVIVDWVRQVWFSARFPIPSCDYIFFV